MLIAILHKLRHLQYSTSFSVFHSKTLKNFVISENVGVEFCCLNKKVSKFHVDAKNVLEIALRAKTLFICV